MKLRIPFALMLGAALAFCSGASPALAQTEHSGETVTGVEVRLPAGADARAAIDRIAVRKGQRLSVRALRRSVERLYASGQYADVVVRARPDGEGVALVFELEPLRSIAEVRVQGNTVLSSAQLLSAAKLSRREAFFPEKIQNAVARLEALYLRAGYESARVLAELQEADVGLEVVLRVDEGQPTRVTSLTFSGEPGLPLWRLTETLGLEVGSVLNRDQLDAGVERVRALFREERFHRARVDEPGVGSAAGGASVWIPVVSGPRYVFAFRGNHSFPRGALERVLGYDGSELLDRGLLQRLTRRLEAFYQAQGFFSARVSARELMRPDAREAKITFQVDESRRVSVERITFEGNAFFTKRQLLALVSRRGDQIWSGEGGLNTDPLESEGRGGVKPEVPRPGEEPRRIFSEQLYREAADAIRERYRNEGFLSAEVAFRTADVNLDRGTARVRFQIREGPRTHVASVVAEGAPPGVDLAALSTLRPGQPLSASAPEVQRVLLTRELNRRGYLFAQVEVRPELSPSPSEGVQHARVRVLARPGPQVRVGQVIVQGSGRSDERMVRANLSLREGQVLDPESLYASQRDLLQLGVYRSAVVRLLAPEVEEPTKDIVIELKDRPQLSGDFGIGYSLVEGPRVTTSALYPNVGGRGINVTSRLKLNYVGASALVLSQNSVIDPEEVAGLAGLGGRANVSAVWPRIYTLLPIQLNGRLDLVGERVQRPSFLFTRYAAITGVDWVVNRWLNLALQYEIEHDRVNAVRRAEVFQGQQISSLDEQRLRFDDGIFSLQSLRFTPTLDFRDEPINPRKGFFIQGGAEVTKDLGARVKDALGVLEPTTVFTLKLSGNVTAYVPVVSPVVLAFSARAGTILPLEQGSTTIAPKRFFLGGASSMRGFREDGVIPQDRRTAFRQEREACRALASGAGCSPAASILQSGRELPSPGGEMFTLGKAEARFPAFNAFDLGVFFEAGNLWLSRLDVNLLDVRTAAGVGLRYLTPVGPLVFDLGFNLDPDPALNEQTAYVHFSIGLF